VTIAVTIDEAAGTAIAVETAADAGVVALRITRLEPRWLEGVVELGPAEPTAEGLAVKAATYHHLDVVEHEDGSAEARVFLDV